VKLIAEAAEFVDGGKRRRNIYGKKYQRYAKDNRTAFNRN